MLTRTCRQLPFRLTLYMVIEAGLFAFAAGGGGDVERERSARPGLGEEGEEGQGDTGDIIKY